MTIDYSKLQGLVPAVVQDSTTGEVLMVGFMNDEALAVTQRTGYATFFSRTRGRLCRRQLRLGAADGGR